MNKRILTTIICAVALTAAGCGSQSKSIVGTTAAPEGETAEETVAAESGEESAEVAEETVDELTPEGSAAAARKREAEAAATDLYESEDGWSVHYNSELVDLEEGAGYVSFTYNGDATATNRFEFRYYPNTTTDIVLADVTESYNREELTRSEGYFAGMTDLWCFNADVVSDGRYSTRGYTAVEYNEGVLLLEKRGSIETDEERGNEIADTMAVIADTVEFIDLEPQEEYDYVPGMYELVQEPGETETDPAASAASAGYPEYVALGVNHLGRLGYADPVDIVWYSRDCLIREDSESGAVYNYDIEGDSLYLRLGEDWIEYRKDIMAQTGVQNITVGEKDVTSFKTYENENGWYVYYDSKKFTVEESWEEADFIYGDPGEDTEDAQMLKVRYIEDDRTVEVLGDETINYAYSELVHSEGYVGGGKDAWGFTVIFPASGDGTGSARKLTAVEHNEGVLLFDRPVDSGDGIGNAFEEIINTLMFTEHDHQKEYDFVPGKYVLYDRALQKEATNYPATIRLNRDHSGTFSGNIEKDITWYSSLGVIVEDGPDGASYDYRVEDDTLYIEMDGEWLNYHEKDEEEDDW